MLEQNETQAVELPEEIFSAVLEMTVERLQARMLVPQGPWDSADIGPVEELGREVAFGGFWVIKTRIVRVNWNDKYYITEGCDRYPIAATLSLRAEIPLLRSGEENDNVLAQMRWFIERVAVVVCLPGGEHPLYEIFAKDSLFFALDRFIPESR